MAHPLQRALERITGAVVTTGRRAGNAIERLASAVRLPSAERVHLRQLPPQATSSWTVSGVREALDDHELGVFSESSALMDAMGRDDRIGACINTRTRALLGKNGVAFSLQPNDAAKRRSASLAGRITPWWWRAVPETTLARIQRDVIGLGVSYGRREWAAVDGSWIPRLVPWDAQALSWNETEQRYEAQTSSGMQVVDPGAGWWLYEPAGHHGYMAGAVRALGLPFLMRSFAYRDWARFCERHGMPILAITEPSEAPEDKKASFYQKLRRLGTEGIIRLPKGRDGHGFGVEMLEATDRNGDTFNSFLMRLDVAIAVYTLGQNLTTEVQSGSYAAAKAHERVRQDYLAGDAEGLSTFLREAVILPWGAYNVSGWDNELAPWPTWDTSIPEDKQAKASVLVSLGQAVTAFAAAGLPVDGRALAERFEVPLLASDAPPAPAPTPPAPAPPPEQAARATVRLASGDSPAAARAFVDGQEYSDAVAADGVERGTALLDAGLEELLAVVEAAEGPDDLRTRLSSAFAAASTDELEHLLARALVLAELAGRAAVLGEVVEGVDGGTSPR